MATEAGLNDPEMSVQELVVRHASTIRRILERRSGPFVLKRTTVDDLYQETIAAALASSATFSYRDDASFVAWISTIARRTIGHQLGFPRQAFPSVRIRGEESSGAGVSEGRLASIRRSPSSSAAVHEGENSLRVALNDLPEHYREVIRLYELEQRPLAEVAQRMHRTKGATCRLLARAKDALRSKFEE